MCRYVMRRKLNNTWNYIGEAEDFCSDVLDAKKFKSIDDLVLFAIENNIPKGTIVEEVNFAYTLEPI